NDADLTGATPVISLVGTPANSITATYTFTDSIIAGNGATDATSGNNSIYIFDSGASVVLQNVGLPSAGANRLSADFVLGGTAVAPTITPVFNADPVFASLDYTSGTFLDVTNTAYGTASSTSGPLSGAADYTPAAPPTAVNEW